MTSVVVVTADPAVTVAQASPSVTAVVPVSAAPYAYSSLSGLPTLGTAAALNVGTQANQVVELDASGRLPGVDGSQLTNLPLLPRGIHCGKMRWDGANTVTFIPYKGSWLQINGLLYQIPSAGVAISNAGLVASTLYYLYAYMNGSTMTLELSTTGHTTSATSGNVGTEIKTGDDTRSLVGMIYTNASGQFADSSSQRFMRSWFNDDGVSAGAGSSTQFTTSSTAMVEVDVNVRAVTLMWANESYYFTAMAIAQNNTINGIITMQSSVNGAIVGTSVYLEETASGGYPQTLVSAWAAPVAADGVYTFSIFGDVSANSGTFINKSTAILTQRR